MGPGNTFVYGKRKPFEVGIVREYECLHAGPDLSPEALGAFWSLSGGFTWRSTVDQEVLDPVVATMVLTDPPRLLVCRVLDDGSDNLGRPHLVRVEGVELPMDPAVGEKAGILADPAGWSVGEPTFGVEVSPSSGRSMPGACDFSAQVLGKWVIGPGNYRFKPGSMVPLDTYSLPNIHQGTSGIDPGIWSSDSRSPVQAWEKTSRLPARTGPFRAALTWLLLVSTLVTGGLGLLFRQRLAESQVALQEEQAKLKNKVEELKGDKNKLATLNKKNTDQIVEIKGKEAEIDKLKADNAKLATFERRNIVLEKQNRFLMNSSKLPDGFRKAMEDLNKKGESQAQLIKNHTEVLESFQKGMDSLIQKTKRELNDPGALGGGDKSTMKPAGPKDGLGSSMGELLRPAGRPGAVPPSNDQ